MGTFNIKRHLEISCQFVSLWFSGKNMGFGVRNHGLESWIDPFYAPEGEFESPSLVEQRTSRSFEITFFSLKIIDQNLGRIYDQDQ